MSKVTIQGDASGTGIFTIASPNSNTDRTLVLPDEAGTVLVNGTTSNVGIGTSSPAAKLDVVNGSIRVNEDGAGTKVLTIRSDWAGVDPAINVTTNNSLLLMTSNTERMRIDSAGRVTMPYQPMFSGNRDGFPNIINTAGRVNFNPLVNQGSHWNTSTNLFTCPVAGKYFVSFFSITNSGDTSGDSQVALRKNASVQVRTYNTGSTSQYQSYSGMIVMDCQAGDYIDFYLDLGVVYSGTYTGAVIYLIG